MTSPLPMSRCKRLRVWMFERDITDRAVGEQLGVTASYVNMMLKKNETMPVKHHQKCLELGFPAELLPEPLDKLPGRRAIAVFPNSLHSESQ